ncbi:MAG: ATP-binding protein [Streptococcaceae bacterium]|jgi:DNA replication protein DnaC|nr:ATP-binding protein [Streptococcaceae bacterium]MCH4177281.1 ATP-binding protein [Streptococcaceae bacterium]
MKFDSEDKQKYFDHVVNKIKNGSTHNFILTGKTGRGKTYLATEISKQFNGRVMFVPELLSKMKQAMLKYNDYSPIKFVSKRNQPNVIVLDDFGGRKPTEWEIDQLFRILEYKKVIYIITTNLRSDELAELFGDRILSRVLENMDKSDVYKTQGNDRRLKMKF